MAATTSDLRWGIFTLADTTIAPVHVNFCLLVTSNSCGRCNGLGLCLVCARRPGRARPFHAPTSFVLNDVLSLRHGVASSVPSDSICVTRRQGQQRIATAIWSRSLATASPGYALPRKQTLDERARKPMPHDVVIRGGTAVDGSGGKPNVRAARKAACHKSVGDVLP